MCPLSPLPSGRMSGGNTDILWGINHLSREELGELEIREIIMTLGVTNYQIILYNSMYIVINQVIFIHQLCT